MDDQRNPSKEDRRDVRVRDMMRLRVEIIDPEKEQMMLDRIALERLTTGGDDTVYHSERMQREMEQRETLPNTFLMNRLASIDAKLEALLDYLMMRDIDEKWGQPLPVNISASGILFPHSDDLASGDRIRLELLIQTFPPRPIVVMGEVVRVREPDPTWDTDLPVRLAVRFADIDPDDRDRLVHRIFEVQRMFLRRAKQQAEEPEETVSIPGDDEDDL